MSAKVFFPLFFCIQYNKKYFEKCFSEPIMQTNLKPAIQTLLRSYWRAQEQHKVTYGVHVWGFLLHPDQGDDSLNGGQESLVPLLQLLPCCHLVELGQHTKQGVYLIWKTNQTWTKGFTSSTLPVQDLYGKIIWDKLLPCCHLVELGQHTRQGVHLISKTNQTWTKGFCSSCPKFVW